MKIKKPKRQDDDKPTIMDMAEALDEVIEAVNGLQIAHKVIIGQRKQRGRSQVYSEPSK